MPGREEAQYYYKPATVRFDYSNQQTGFNGISTMLRRPGSPLCRPEAALNPLTNQPDCECTSFDLIKPGWNLGDLRCCSQTFPTPHGNLGQPWCYCERLGNNPEWRLCEQAFIETFSWQYVEIKVALVCDQVGRLGVAPGECELDQCVA